MRISRRTALAAMASAAVLKSQQPGYDFGTVPGPFRPSRESLSAYKIPEWFRDAKFGIWAHWGPQSAVEDGDWYARNMYIQGSPQNRYHVEHYGPPSKVGYKDLIPNWHAAEWDPDHLMDLYKKAGAKYFFSMGVHHDNFDLWNSSYQSWNALQMGPKKDVVGIWQKAARDRGLKFGVSEHLWITYKWFSVSHGHDTTGPYANVPYDGANPEFWSLYTSDPTVYEKDLPWNEDNIPESCKQHWCNRINDLVTKYKPDMLYTDGALPFEDFGFDVVANLYNLNASRNAGATEAVYFSKRVEDSEQGVCALDVERGVVNGIWPRPWQTDTCIGDWHYKRDIQYKRPKQVIDLLVDVVSRNGNLLLNFPLPNSGKLDDREMAVLNEITAWTQVNGDGIFSTRPWKVFGNAPAASAPEAADAKFNESKRRDLSASDVRFTSKGNTIYAFVMGDPGASVSIQQLGASSDLQPPKVENVGLLGHDGKLEWKQAAEGLQVSLPQEKPSKYAICLRMTVG